MPLTRASILRGPAIVTFNGATFYAKDDIVLGGGLETFDLEVSAFGKVDERVRDRRVTVAFTPSGAWTALATLFPYGSMTVGASLFAADTPLVIQTLAGIALTFNAAALTKMPRILLSAQKTLLGPVEFTCVGRDNSLWSASNSFYSSAPSPFSDTNFVETGIVTQGYDIAWGATPPWNSLSTQDGVTVDFELGLRPVETDSDGLVDLTFEKLAVTARMRPVGLTEAQALDALVLQGAGAARGRSLNAGGQTLSITGLSGVVQVALNGANLTAARQLFGTKALRLDELAFVATRNFLQGLPSPLFTVS